MVDRFDEYRGEILTNLIVGLAERNDTQGAPSRKLKELKTLDIANLPCRSQPDLTDHPKFSTLLRTLQTLLLQFDYTSDYHEPYVHSPLGGESHEFFTHLPGTWLAPAATDLTCLSLRAPELWGYLLKVDFRGVHFPRLMSLVMQKFVFSHDWQLEWILSHTTLKTLCLFQCRILTHARWFGEKDSEGYPTSFSESDTLPPEDHHYDKSWHQYYQQFSSLLKSLEWFTTKPNDRSAVPNLIGLYEKFDGESWLEVIPEPGRRAEDERMLIHLKVTAFNHLKATAKRRPRH